MEKPRPPIKKFTRTISGVTPVAVMTRPMSCPGRCVYCPTYAATPQSYTPESPAVLRGRECGFDARRQVQVRVKGLAEMGHPTDKVELIIMGGTFLSATQDYQHGFIKQCYDGLNGTESKDLDEAKRMNETAGSRCVGLCIETRPDYCGQTEINRMLEFGTTRVELGVQVLDDEIYRLVQRGHTVADVVDATRFLKQHGFKVHYHWMPGLPGSSPEHDLEMSRQLFDDPRFRPDGLKIYPTMVVAGTELEQWHRDGRYEPYDNNVMLDLVADIKALVPPYVRISRVLRDIPVKFVTAGLKDSLRGPVKRRMQEKGVECRCIRCREYGHRVVLGRETGKPVLKRLDYEASGGREIFLSFEDAGGTLFGLLRLRVQPEPIPAVARESGGATAIVRELHVFGAEVPLHRQDAGSAQHRGFGKALLREAERVAREEFRVKSLFILSGVGAREYYRTEFGYTALGAFMVKNLDQINWKSEIPISKPE
ncbi:MAG: tRNA uridine(34) 5-carboxymethylaminomethyl modification radical SAM/GNAT enzyme Elp3 [Dehalococcoidia bacterium]|nr:tRNA uridine(34) 5-carboxymethylaminomethyl modification radical SAM/GNAT enzyme Elp3 [Dehalococcoidia bacterium]